MKNKNFLKKLAAVTLGFVMTLGVGAAGYAASANEAKATLSSPVDFTFMSTTLPSGWTATNDPTGAETNNDARGTAWNSKGTVLSYTLGDDYDGWSVSKIEIVCSSNGSSRSVKVGTQTALSVSSGTKHATKSFNTDYAKGDTIEVTVGGSNKTLWIEKISFTLSEDSGGGGGGGTSELTDGTWEFTISKDDFTTGGYAANDGNHQSTAHLVSDTTKTALVTWKSSNVFQNNGAMQWKSGSGTIQNVTDLNIVNSVTLTTANYVSETHSGGDFEVSCSGGTGSTASVTVNFTIGEPHSVGDISGSSEVYVGKTATYSASCSKKDTVTWSVENGTGSATIVEGTGVLTGVTAGTVTVKASCAGGDSSTKTVTIKADVKTLLSISASGAKSTFTKGDSFETTGLVVTGTYSHTNGDADSQEQITTGITTSPSAGTKLNTVGPQTVTVNAGEKQTTYSINVNYAAVESIELDYEEGTLGKGAETTLPGTSVLPENANQGVSWTEHADNATSGISYSYDPSTLKVTVSADNSVAGTLTFIATATGDSSKKATVVYTVQAAQIAHITEVTASATGAIVAKQYVGDAFNPQGFSFAPTWSEGDHDVLVITADDISWNALVAGSNPTGTYLCADGEFTVTITGVTVVNDTLVSIAFSEGCDMTKKSYWVGDSWDFSGLSIVGTMDSGKTAPAISSSSVTFSSNKAVATTTTSITVTAEYNNLTATKEISGIVVNEVTMDSLTVNYTGGQPVLGTDFTFAGSITANMSNDTHPTVNLSDVTIGSVDKFTLNQQTITVTHKTTGATGTFNVTYKIKTITTTKVWKEVPFGEGNLLITTVYDSTNYYLPTAESSNTGPSAISFTKTNNLPDISTDNANDLLFSVTKNDDGTYSIKNGDKFLYTTSDNNGVRVASTSSGNKWTYDISDNYLKNNLSTARYLGVYNGSQWRSYNSSTASNYNGSAKNLKFYTIEEKTSGSADIIKLNAALKSGKTFNEGATISASDFDCSTLDNLNQTKTVTATSVSPAKLVAGDNTITVYYNTWSTTVTVNAAEVAHLDHIEVVEGTGTRSFTRGTSFNSTGVKIKAYYSNTDKTKFPDRELTSGFTVTPLTSTQMNVADTYNVSVSYTENGVTKNTTYSVTVTPKVSTSVTIAGNGIEGSNGAYTLASGVTNEVDLTLGCDGDETVEFVQGDQNVVTFANGKLSVNSSTKTGEQITVSFKAGTATATLTVNISAAEGITLISDEHISGFIGDDLEVEISLSNVESATWTFPSGFTVKETSKDNTGFVGTISSSVECEDAPAVFSALTGKGETLSVIVYVTANYDSIVSIDASTSRTYVAGQSEFSKSDLTVTYERESGASGTLDSDEFTLSNEPTGILLAKSYTISVASVENPNATTSCTIEAGVPSGSNVVAKTVTDVPGATVWQKVTDLSTLSTSKQYTLIYENGDSSYMFNNTDAGSAYISKILSNNECSYASTDPYLTINYNASTNEASIKCVGGSDTLAGKYIYGKSGNNSITYGENETMMSFNMVGDDNHIEAISNSTSFRFNATAGDSNMRFRFYKTSTSDDAYHYPCLYEKVTKQGTQQISYSNTQQMSASLFNFIFSSYDEENGFKVSWSALETEYDKLGSTEKELLENGVQSGTINNVDTPSCDLFKDFITAYDVEVARLGSTSNFMDRPLADTGSITIDYNDGTTSPETFNYPVGNYKLPAAPTCAGYVFKGWSVNGSTELKQPNQTVAITKGGSVVITAEWDIAISLTNSAEFKFTGLEMTRFQYVFEGTCPKGAQSGFLVSTSGDADLLLSLTDEKIKAGNNAGVTEVNKADNKLVIGTGDGSKIVSVMFYYIDEDGNVEKTDVITMSFDSFVTAKGFDPSIYEDKYAIVCLQYYIAGLQNK